MPQKKNKISKEELFNQQTSEKAQRKLNSQKKHRPNLYYGFRVTGMVGWSVTIPVLLGVSIGMWLDKNYPQSFSWTLNGLIVGILYGCYLAWHWISKEHKKINKKDDE